MDEEEQANKKYKELRKLLQESRNKPFPEHLCEDINEKGKAFLKKHWSGDIDEFFSNCEKALGFKDVKVVNRDGKFGIQYTRVE